MSRVRRVSLALLSLALAACAPCPVQTPQAAPAPSGPPSPAPLEPSRVEPGDTMLVDEPADSARIIEVLMHTRREGATGEFAPRVVHARRGDVLRFRMADGSSIHNVSFASFANDTRGVPLPHDGPFLTSEGQSWQVRIDLLPGRYEFACVPHAETGHRGVLVVEP